MKIVDVCAFYAPRGGGVRTYVDRKLAAAAAAGHEITVIAPARTDDVEIRAPGARIVRLASPRFPLDGNYRYFGDEAALHRLIQRESPDVVEASSPWRSASMVAAWPGRAQRSLVMHCDPLAAYAYRWFGRIASRQAIDRRFDWFWRHLRTLDAAFDTIVCASDELAERLRRGGLRRVVTNPMGVEAKLFSPGLRDESLRRQLLERCALGPEASLLIGVGRHGPEKRWPMIVSAVTAASYRKPVGLLLVGDGRERARIQRQVDGNPHIHLLAPIADRTALARLLASGDALVHGCEAETFCMVAAEARASGLPLIVPDRGGAGDQLAAGGGFAFQAGDAASAARAIVRLVAELGELRRRSRETAGLVRTMDRHFGDLFAHYQALQAPARCAA